MDSSLLLRYHPSGALKYHKGVTYAEDGRTVVDSLFQRIASGVEAPGGEEKEVGQLSVCSPDIFPVTLHSAYTRDSTNHSTDVFQLCFQDERVACFVPMNAVSRHGHVLVVPRGAHRTTTMVPSTTTASQGSPITPAPLQIIRTVNDLEFDDVEFLRHMRHVGATVLKQRLQTEYMSSSSPSSSSSSAPRIDIESPATTEARATSEEAKSQAAASFLFHRPPFNSIDHLHLHCIAEGPRLRAKDWIKYPPPLAWGGAMVPWCVSLEATLTRLSKS
jgi:hypothetical protein